MDIEKTENNKCEESKRKTKRTTKPKVVIPKLSPIEDFNVLIINAHCLVMKRWQNASFYEAGATLIKNEDKMLDGKVLTNSFHAFYVLHSSMEIIHVNAKKGIFTFDVEQPRTCDNLPMSPYVTFTAKNAIELITSKLGNDIIDEGSIVLRHILYPNEIEPRYIFGEIDDPHSINIYSHKIDDYIGTQETIETIDEEIIEEKITNEINSSKFVRWFKSIFRLA